MMRHANLIAPASRAGMILRERRREAAVALLLASAACVSPEPSTPAATTQEFVAGAPVLTVTQQSDLVQRLWAHWPAPCDKPSPESLAVTVTFTLNLDGTLASSPGVQGVDIDSPDHVAAGEDARRAVLRAFEDGPFDFLPADRYEDWKTVTLNFLPGPACGIE